MEIRKHLLPRAPRHLGAVIFDLDGTLVDSEHIYRRSDQAFLASKGITLPEELWPGFVGMGARAFIQLMQDEHALPGSIDALIIEKDSWFQRMARVELRSFPQVVALNAAARQVGLKTAVASGSNPEAIRASLAFAAIGQPFDEILSSLQVPRGKPAPDVFLEAARRIGVPPQYCLVVEDSVVGARAGLAAGMLVLALPWEESKADHEVYDQVHFHNQGNASVFDHGNFIQTLQELALWPR